MAAVSHVFIPSRTSPNINIHNGLLPSRVPCVKSSTLSISISIPIPPQYHSRSLHVPRVISAVVAWRRVFRSTALAQEAEQITEQPQSAEEHGPENAEEQKPEEKSPVLPSKETILYVGNLPSDCDDAQLTQIFSEFGTVESVEVIHNEETGTSRGFAYVTMGNYNDATSAIEKLRGCDLGGRDMLVHLPARLLFMGIGYKVSVSNLPWSVKKESLISLFSQHGNVIAAKVIYDRKEGVPRVYGFVYLSTRSGMEAAIAALNEKEYNGRKLVVRKAKPNSELEKPAEMNEDNKSKTSGTVVTESPYKVYVGNLSRSLNTKALQDLFSQYGNVLDARVIFDRKSNSARVYGFINYSSQTEVDSAIAALHGKEFYNRTLVVREAKQKSQG